VAQITHKITFSADGAPSARMIAIGMAGDNNAHVLLFDVPEITADQQVYVNIETPGGVTDTIRLYADAEGLYGWSIEASAVVQFGKGKAQVKVFDALDPLRPKWQSGQIGLSIGASLDTDAQLDYKYPTAIEQMEAEMQRVEAATKASEQAAAGSAAAAAGSAGDAAGSASVAAGSADRAAKSVADAAKHVASAQASATSAAASAEDARKSADEAAQIVTGNLDTRYVKLADYTDAAVIGKVKAVDGSGSGLDADLLDGKQGSEYAAKQHTHAQGEVTGLSGSLSGLTSRVDGLAGSKADKPQTYTAVLTAAGWTGSKAPYTQTVSIAGVPAEGVVIVGLAAGATEQQIEVCRSARIEPTQQTAGAIMVAAHGVKPGVDLPISATVVK
jgi:hypothetical protein